jgi:hypothetical protein
MEEAVINREYFSVFGYQWRCNGYGILSVYYQQLIRNRYGKY